MRRILFALLASAAMLTPAAADPQPNIIVIMADDLRHDICDLGMTRVCGEAEFGRTYVNAFTCHSVCSPARTCFFTGQTTDQHGVIGEGNKITDRFNLLPEQMSEAGYFTAIYGKDPQGVPFRMNRIGFDDFAVFYGGEADAEGQSRYFDPTFDTPNGEVQETGYTPTLIGNKCIDAAETAPQPFFLVCADASPHPPNTPKPEHEGDCANLNVPVNGRPSFNEANISDKPGWFDPVLLTPQKEDKQVQKWRTTCETMKESDKWVRTLARKARPGSATERGTVVFYTSDHGTLMGEHRLTGKNVAFDEAIRIPLIIWGGNFAPGIDHRLVSMTDLTATVLALAGATAGLPPDPTARDVRGAQRTSVTGTAAWGENEVKPGPNGITHWIAEPGWRYFSNGPDGGDEMYDMTADPWQVNNIAAQPPRSPRQKRYRRMVGR